MFFKASIRVEIRLVSFAGCIGGGRQKSRRAQQKISLKKNCRVVHGSGQLRRFVTGRIVSADTTRLVRFFHLVALSRHNPRCQFRLTRPTGRVMTRENPCIIGTFRNGYMGTYQSCVGNRHFRETPERSGQVPGERFHDVPRWTWHGSC